jgi:hypothetical protein
MKTTLQNATDKRIANPPQDIPGWGVDANPQNNPTYPMKNYDGSDHNRLNYERAPQQPVNMEILHSNERPSVTRVFGTSTPPKGLSGMLRRVAFRYSEGSSGHWLTLILADRVNVVEGLIDDLKQGYVPNFFKERGWTAEWKYNRKNFVRNVAVGVGIAAAVIAIAAATRKKERLIAYE